MTNKVKYRTVKYSTVKSDGAPETETAGLTDLIIFMLLRIIASFGLYFSKKFWRCAEYLRVITAQRFGMLKNLWNPSKSLSFRNVSS